MFQKLYKSFSLWILIFQRCETLLHTSLITSSHWFLPRSVVSPTSAELSHGSDVIIACQSSPKSSSPSDFTDVVSSPSSASNDANDGLANDFRFRRPKNHFRTMRWINSCRNLAYVLRLHSTTLAEPMADIRTVAKYFAGVQEIYHFLH